VNQRARDLVVVMAGQLAWLGPDVRSLSVVVMLSWTTIRVGVANDERLREVAEDLGLTQATTQRRGRVWWRQAEARGEGVVMIAAGPHHEGEPPANEEQP
jgi:hypothetical protein